MALVQFICHRNHQFLCHRNENFLTVQFRANSEHTDSTKADTYLILIPSTSSNHSTPSMVVSPICVHNAASHRSQP